MSEKIKKCPFCGGKGELIQEYDDWYVYCIVCDCEMIRTTKKKAIKMWNKRV